VVIPFAAWKAAQGELNVYLVFLSGTIGALAGALINYYLSKYLKKGHNMTRLLRQTVYLPFPCSI